MHREQQECKRIGWTAGACEQPVALQNPRSRLPPCFLYPACQQIPVPSWRSNSRSETLSSLKGQQHHYSAHVATKMPASLPTASSAGLHAAACKQPRLGGKGGEGRNQHFAPHSVAVHSLHFPQTSTANPDMVIVFKNTELRRGFGLPSLYITS